MNRNIYLYDLSTSDYLRKVNDMNKWLKDNHFIHHFHYDKRNDTYNYRKNKLSLEELIKYMTELIPHFIKYEHLRPTELLECCGVKYSFENFCKHILEHHNIEINVSESSEFLYCSDCGDKIPLKKEDLILHLNVHYESMYYFDFDEISDEEREKYHACEICLEKENDYITFRKDNNYSLGRYLLHLSTHYESKGHSVDISTSTCKCGFSGTLEELINHFGKKIKKIEMNPESLVIKSNPILKENNCPICLENHQDIVYMCLQCKNGFCLQTCATPLLKEKKECPICRNYEF